MIPEITIPFFHSLVHSFSKREEKKRKLPVFQSRKEVTVYRIKKRKKEFRERIKNKKKKKKIHANLGTTVTDF